MLLLRKHHTMALIACLSLMAGAKCYASQEPEMTFRHLGVIDGLSQNTVLSIAQDRLGQLWFGTQNGLNVFDGYNFKTFYSDPADSTSLPDNLVYALTLGSDRMWIGTASGLASYNFASEEFTEHPLSSKGHVYNILEHDGRLLLSTDRGLWYYNPKDSSSDKDPFISDRQVRSTFYADGIILAATDKGLVSIDGAQVKDVEAFKGMDIYAIAQVGGTGWGIGTYGHGLFRTDSHFSIIRQFSKDNGELPSNHIRVMKTDGYGRLWVGTYDGLAIYDDLSGSFRSYAHSESPNSISHNSIRAILVDGQKGVWLGTWFGGINYWNRQDDKLRTISFPGKEVYGFVSCLEEDPDTGTIWVGTNDDGVWRYFPSDERLEQLNLRGNSSNIKCIALGSDGRVYIGTHLGGLIRISKDGRHMRIFKVNDEVSINNSCYSLMEEEDGKWWVGTLEGLLAYDSARESFSTHPAALLEPKLQHSLITCLLKDSKERIWIGTESGLYMFPPSADKVLSGREIHPGIRIEDYYVTRILQDKSGNIWIATKRGLIRYEDSGESRLYTVKDDLPNDMICGILDDESGMLWISTGYGICCLNPDSGAIRSISRSVKNEYNAGVSCMSSDGHFYFGGLEGITSFRPLDMYTNPFTPQPFFKNVTINGRGSRTLRRSSDGNLSAVILSEDVNMFTISWSVVNPLSNGDNNFTYRLEGFDNTSYQTRERQVTYSNMHPGRYILHLTATNSEGKVCSGETVLSLKVLPKWWQTTSMRILALLAALLLAAGTVWLVASRISTGLSLKDERRERMRTEESLRQTREILLKQMSGPEHREFMSADEEFLQRARQVVEDNIDNESFSSSDFAEKMFMSRSNLYLRITSLTGESATYFIRRIRLDKACHLLLEHKYSIAEISAMVGFSSPSYFTTSFKKYIGCLPTEYGKK